ncbi:PDDEXK nuclease domain-containing protein [Pedobacter glucosidilyticus]|uniref:PDDEXK nuclease domain-containing protein n=1 Tax=Pedobacter glucosidilyticus TaxID=1122941 RepID=UPI0003FC3AD7|nr:PDDEXK nuclease domain-containing protein [Pedobacter glucosidilyticus]
MQYIQEIKQILAQARQRSYQAINTAMVEAYWRIGEKIVLEEQNGKDRAGYGKEIIKNVAIELTKEFGKGFSARTLWEIRQFYLCFPQFQIVRTLSAQLSWSHFQRIMRVNDTNARQYYLEEAAQNMWSVRTLDRNISTLYYHRLLSSQVKEPVEAEMQEKTQSLQQDAFEFIKSPAVLEFLNLPNNLGYTEQALESSLIDNLQKFILELGKGFAFVERQQLVRTETSDFYIDLVFYNYILKCFVIIDIKTTKITHQDVGQLDMYVRMYNDLKKQTTDNPTIGILLCTETDKTIAKYSVLAENKQLFATKYLPYLPTEEELIAEIEREKALLNLRNTPNE